MLALAPPHWVLTLTTRKPEELLGPEEGNQALWSWGVMEGGGGAPARGPVGERGVLALEVRVASGTQVGWVGGCVGFGGGLSLPSSMEPLFPRCPSFSDSSRSRA